MSGPHLLKKGREHRKMDVHRDFTVASPAEFVTRFGGNQVIDKVRRPFLSARAIFGVSKKIETKICTSVFAGLR